MPTLGLTLPVTVQLVIADAEGTICFENTFTSATQTSSDSFKAKGP
jgi:hypothetical protein